MFDETLQSEESCLWFDEFDDGDLEPLFDEEDEDDGDQEQEEDGDDELVRRQVVEYRCSPVCRFSPTVRMLIERLSEPINELLNIFGEALNESVYVYAPYPPYRFTSRRDRIFYAGHLAGPGEIEAVRHELRTERERLHADLLGVTGDSPRTEFQRVEHRLRDYRILVALAGCHHEHLFHWWDSTLIRLQQREPLRQFYRARDAMRARDPDERKAACARDAKRRKTRHRKEYLAAYEARPEVRAKRAERKRAERARARRCDQEEAASLVTLPCISVPHAGMARDEHDCPRESGAIGADAEDSRVA